MYKVEAYYVLYDNAVFLVMCAGNILLIRVCSVIVFLLAGVLAVL